MKECNGTRGMGHSKAGYKHVLRRMQIGPVVTFAMASCVGVGRRLKTSASSRIAKS